jgi:hypothetical protein
LIVSLREELRDPDERIKRYERLIKQVSINSEPYRRLRSIPGVGPISATRA